VDVRIGVIHTGKEIDIELADDVDRDKLVKSVEDAMSDDAKVLWFTDKKGRRFGVPSGRVAYVEIGGPHDERRVGFGGP
jgi:hypothetical protein